MPAVSYADYPTLGRLLGTWLSWAENRAARYVFVGENHNDLGSVFFAYSKFFLSAAKKEDIEVIAREWPAGLQGDMQKFNALKPGSLWVPMRAILIANRVYNGFIENAALRTHEFQQAIAQGLIDAKKEGLEILPSDIRFSERLTSIFNDDKSEKNVELDDDLRVAAAGVLQEAHKLGFISSDVDIFSHVKNIFNDMFFYGAPVKSGGDIDKAMGLYIAKMTGGRRTLVHGGLAHSNQALCEGLGVEHVPTLCLSEKPDEAIYDFIARVATGFSPKAPDLLIVSQNRILPAAYCRPLIAASKRLGEVWLKKFPNTPTNIPEDIFERMINPHPARPGEVHARFVLGSPHP